MDKYAIEIETSAGWVTFHSIMRPGEEKARSVLEELKKDLPNSKLRIVKITKTVVEK